MNFMLKMMYSMESLTEQIEKKGHYFLLAKDNHDYVGFASYELNYSKQ
jgi:diamine N-acetyltransferase